MAIFVVITRGYAKVPCYCIPEKLFSAFGDKANDFSEGGRAMTVLFVIEISIFLLTLHTTVYKLIVFTGVGLNS